MWNQTNNKNTCKKDVENDFKDGNGTDFNWKYDDLFVLEKERTIYKLKQVIPVVGSAMMVSRRLVIWAWLGNISEESKREKPLLRSEYRKETNPVKDTQLELIPW